MSFQASQKSADARTRSVPVSFMRSAFTRDVPALVRRKRVTLFERAPGVRRDTCPRRTPVRRWARHRRARRHRVCIRPPWREIMPNLLQHHWWLVALRGIAAILFGFLAWIAPGASLLALVILFGAFALVDGAFILVWGITHPRAARAGWLVVRGVAGIAAGILTFLWPGITALALLFLIGAWAIIAGVTELVAAIRLRDQIRGTWLMGFAGVLTIFFGTLLELFPGPGALAVTLWIGAYAVVFGVLLLVLAFRMRASRRDHATMGDGLPSPT